jgi:hypothetical protein
MTVVIELNVSSATEFAAASSVCTFFESLR